VEFFVVYIQEAHPSDAWQMRSNLEQNVVFKTPRTDEERSEVAGICLVKLGIELPAVLDGIDNRTEAAYTGWPDRLYVIDRDGRIAFKSKPGPFGFKPDGVEKTLQKLVPSVSK
jgi:hypothetical protein